MTITKLLSGLPLRTMDQATFDTAVAQLMTDIPAWGQEVNATAANLNSLAAGGAYAIPYVFSNGGDIGFTGGRLSFGGYSSQSATLEIYVDNTSAGTDVSALLDSFVSGATSSPKGTIRIQKVGDASKWLVFNVTSLTSVTNPERQYKYFAGTTVAASSANPFLTGDLVMLFFQRTGDRGDTGPVATFPQMHLYESASPGVNSIAPTNIQSGVWRHPINNVRWNGVSGASVASNQITLPAGNYDIHVVAKGQVSTGSPGGLYRHFIALYNVTDGAYVLYGPQALSFDRFNDASYITEAASLSGMFSTAATNTFELRHLTPTANMASVAATNAAGTAEIYTEIVITRKS